MMPPRRRTLRSVASDGENSDEASTQPADQHIRGWGRGRGQGVRGRGARVRGGRASQTTRESIPAQTENRRPPRCSALEAAVVGLHGVVEALASLIAEQRAEDGPQVTLEVMPNQPEPLVQPVQDEEAVVSARRIETRNLDDGSFSKKRKWGNEGKSLVQDSSIEGSKLQNRAHTLPEAPTYSRKSAASVTRSKSEARGVGLSSFQGIRKLASSVDNWVYKEELPTTTIQIGSRFHQAFSPFFFNATSHENYFHISR
ncbi:uncharacterized protein G2W53_033103 [Senna tora]|uniref:Uncharacterized protein n=1 Tax=Senna tora TaxID=362788 RepID=A0A834SZH1_9FABA|nr:uncharacterized protein G2W53_033103 [Senna tora]